MDGQQTNDITPEDMEEMMELREEELEDNQEDNFITNQELVEGYGGVQPDETLNAHSFLHKAAFGSRDTVRTTFLQEGELGRPLFTVRFMLDMEDIAHYYLDPLLREMNLNPKDYNLIATYFWQKIQNVTQSGMSNKGFAMNLNVTRKMDTIRRRVKNSIEQLKGGKTS